MDDQEQYAKLFNEFDSQMLITLGVILVSGDSTGWLIDFMDSCGSECLR